MWAGSPLTDTRPATIRSSMSRREPRPASASTLCSFGASSSEVRSRLGALTGPPRPPSLASKASEVTYENTASASSPPRASCGAAGRDCPSCSSLTRGLPSAGALRARATFRRACSRRAFDAFRDDAFGLRRTRFARSASAHRCGFGARWRLFAHLARTARRARTASWRGARRPAAEARRPDWRPLRAALRRLRPWPGSPWPGAACAAPPDDRRSASMAASARQAETAASAAERRGRGRRGAAQPRRRLGRLGRLARGLVMPAALSASICALVRRFGLAAASPWSAGGDSVGWFNCCVHRSVCLSSADLAQRHVCLWRRVVHAALQRWSAASLRLRLRSPPAPSLSAAILRHRLVKIFLQCRLQRGHLAAVADGRHFLQGRQLRQAVQSQIVEKLLRGAQQGRAGRSLRGAR